LYPWSSRKNFETSGHKNKRPNGLGFFIARSFNRCSEIGLYGKGTRVYDEENRLISTTVGATTTGYVYDAFSRRIGRIHPSATTCQISDGWNLIAEYTSTGGAAPVLM
jgi:YD repeat-containing protein